MVKKHQVLLKLNLAQRTLMKFVDREVLEKTGATATQLAAIFYLMENDGCQLVDLSRELLQNKSAITTLVERMEKNGLIQKEQSSTDKRASQLFLTSKGNTCGRNALPLISLYNNELTKDFNTSELAVIIRFLDRIIDTFETSAGNYFNNKMETPPSSE